MNKRLCALGVLLAVGIGGCGDDDPKPTRPDGSVVPGPDAGDAGGPITGQDGQVLVPDGDGGFVEVPKDGSVVVPGDGGNTEGGVVPPGPNTANLGKAGGTVASADGRLTVTVARNALARPSTFVVKPAETPPPLAALGTVYEITPRNEKLSEPAEVTLKFNGLNLGGTQPRDLVIAQWDGADWDPLPVTRFDPTAMTVTAKIPSFAPIAFITALCEGCQPCDATLCPGGTCAPIGNGCTTCRIPCDTDGDGYCAGTSPAGGARGGDCAPSDPTRYPGAQELLNNVDDDCNQFADDGVKPCAMGCEVGQSCKNGVCTQCGSCDPANCKIPAFVQPGEAQFDGKCFNFGVENLCSECVPTCDMDGDGQCGPPGFGQPGGDCDDTNPNVRSGFDAKEICGDGLDNDCAGGVDDGCTVCATDNECPAVTPACVTGVCVACPTTCDGASCAARGAGALCKPYGKDNLCSRCSPACDVDNDGACVNAAGDFSGGDCDDNNPRRFPNPESSIAELCGNTVDDNCNGFVDDGCAACTSSDQCPAQQLCTNGTCTVCNVCTTCTIGIDHASPGTRPGVPGTCFDQGKGCSECRQACDKDGDGFCTNADAEAARVAAGALVVAGAFQGGDCDDTKPNVYTGASEICGDTLDNDCDGKVDEECNLCASSAMCGAAEACSNGM
jgi:hypothetical protein